jgi:hypothetical protein
MHIRHGKQMAYEMGPYTTEIVIMILSFFRGFKKHSGTFIWL